jgi:hypothetical protein
MPVTDRGEASRMLRLILVPMLTVFAAQRLYLHLIPIRHVVVAGYLVHHLYTGALILIPAAFVLAFGVRHRPLAWLAPVALGVGSAMVLDEVSYLVTTQATDADYRSPLSLGGAIVLMGLATGLLLALYRVHRGKG